MRLVLLAAAGLALPALVWLLLRDGEAPAGTGVVRAPPAAMTRVPSPAAPVPEPEPEPILTQVVLAGSRSAARFRMPDGAVREVMVGGELRPGWRLAKVTSASATFETPQGRLGYGLSGVAITVGEPPAAPGARRPVTVEPERPAVDAEGAAATRCGDPEC